MPAQSLKELKVSQARFIAILARNARAQRDALLGNVPEDDIGEPMPGRGEHNPTAVLGFDPLAQKDLQVAALREAIASLSNVSCSELYTLMRIGQGDLAANKWYRGFSEAQLLGDDTIRAAILENADLHDHIMKGLYEANLS